MLMEEDYKKLFSYLEPFEPPGGLFEKVLLAIKKEKEFQRKKRLSFVFGILFIFSIFSVPFSAKLLIEQISISGTFYFLVTALNDFENFLLFWQDFILAIAESLPIMTITFFVINITILLFILRFFLNNRKLLVEFTTILKLRKI